MISNSIKSLFTQTYTEKDVIRGHSVDRYRYALQILTNSSDENLIVAYSWLSLASYEVDMKAEAERQKRQIEYEIKKINLFEKALEIETIYRSKFSAVAILEKLKISRNPLNFILYKFFISVQKIGEYFENKFKK